MDSTNIVDSASQAPKFADFDARKNRKKWAKSLQISSGKIENSKKG